MRLSLIAIGRMKSGPERELMTRYVERAGVLARSVGLTSFCLRELPEGGARTAADRMREESRAILADLPAGTLVIALDERGSSLSSADFAHLLGAARDAGRSAAALVIGGPDGLDPTFRGRADRMIAYGAATFPHQLVRVMAAEQIYRAMTILAGHPYHRA